MSDVVKGNVSKGASLKGILNVAKGDKGESGVYVGSGDMPENCNVQIDPNGEVFAPDYFATVEKVFYEGALYSDIPPSIWEDQKGDWLVQSTYVPDDSGIFYLVYGIEDDTGSIAPRGQIDMPTNIITPDKLPTGTRININGDGHWIKLAVIKDVKDKADKIYVDSKIGDINSILATLVDIE